MRAAPTCPLSRRGWKRAESYEPTSTKVFESLLESGLRHAALHLSQDIGSLWRVDWAELGAAFLSDLEGYDA